MLLHWVLGRTSGVHRTQHTLPCGVWYFDKHAPAGSKSTHQKWNRNLCGNCSLPKHKRARGTKAMSSIEQDMYMSNGKNRMAKSFPRKRFWGRTTHFWHPQTQAKLHAFLGILNRMMIFSEVRECQVLSFSLERLQILWKLETMKSRAIRDVAWFFILIWWIAVVKESVSTQGKSVFSNSPSSEELLTKLFLVLPQNHENCWKILLAICCFFSTNPASKLHFFFSLCSNFHFFQQTTGYVSCVVY